jgi:glycosyltransferase involved in cell wall biosynthesis
MKVIHVCESAALHGVQRHIITLAAAQKARGLNPVVIVGQPGYLVEACERHGIPVSVAQQLHTGDGSWMFPTEETVAELMATFIRMGADIIHAHTLASLAKAVRAGNKSGISCVFTHHLVSSHQFAIIAKQLGINFKTISVSRVGFNMLGKLGYPSADLYYIPSGTPVMPRESPREGDPGGRSLILVGHLDFIKGIDIAILAMSELRRRGRCCPILNIYGRGALRNYLEEMVAVLGLAEAVRFCGTQPDILADCPSTDILIMPSRNESGPLVVAEAMSRGMPIVSSDVGGVREMLPDEQYGRIAPPGSPVALADSIEALLSDIADGTTKPELLISRHRALYTDERMAQCIERVYEDAQSSPLGRRPELDPSSGSLLT